MPTVYIPAPMRPLMDGQDQLAVEDAATVQEAVEQLEQAHPGALERLTELHEGRRILRRGLQVTVNGSLSAKGLRQSLESGDEVHFLPAIGGG